MFGSQLDRDFATSAPQERCLWIRISGLRRTRITMPPRPNQIRSRRSRRTFPREPSG